MPLAAGASRCGSLGVTHGRVHQSARGRHPAALQGNWGSALLAYGDVKKQLLQQLFEGPQPTAPEQVAAVNASRKRLREEALAALLEAGVLR